MKEKLLDTVKANHPLYWHWLQACDVNVKQHPNTGHYLVGIVAPTAYYHETLKSDKVAWRLIELAEETLCAEVEIDFSLRESA